MYAPLHSYWNTGINLIHIDLRTLDQRIESIERQIKFFKYENYFADTIWTLSDDELGI